MYFSQSASGTTLKQHYAINRFWTSTAINWIMAFKITINCESTFFAHPIYKVDQSGECSPLNYKVLGLLFFKFCPGRRKSENECFCCLSKAGVSQVLTWCTLSEYACRDGRSCVPHEAKGAHPSFTLSVTRLFFFPPSSREKMHSGH